MGLRINQNIAAMNSYRNLSVTDTQMSKSLEKLSSGFRINRAADDAAGLSISEGLRAQVGGLKVAVRNAQDGISVVQTAEGALTETHSILQRMRDLAVQASNAGSQDTNAQNAANTEFTDLKTELDRIGNTTAFGTTKLLDGSYGVQAASLSFSHTGTYTTAGDEAFTLSFTNGNLGGSSVNVTVGALAGVDSATFAAHIESRIKSALQGGTSNQAAVASEVHVTASANAAGTSSTIEIKIGGLGGTNNATFTTADTAGGGNLTGVTGYAHGTSTALQGSGGTFQVGANNHTNEQISVAIGDMRTSGAALSLSAVNLSSTTNAQSAITALDNAIKNVSTTRSQLGAYQNRFEHTINNLNVAVENLSASESRIRDTDMAQEMVAFTRSQILSQAGTAMLAQANQAPQSVLSLLRG